MWSVVLFSCTDNTVGGRQMSLLPNEPLMDFMGPFTKIEHLMDEMVIWSAASFPLLDVIQRLLYSNENQMEIWGVWAG